MAASTAPMYLNNQDFVDADKGFLRNRKLCIIPNSERTAVVWNNEKYNFLQDKCPPTAHPSLWRQSQLCSKQGLYEVVKDQIYQVRGFDLSNMTIVRSDHGVIIIDPLISKECSEAALKLYSEEFPDLVTRATAIIYTHSHIDHYGGAEGVLPLDRSRPVRIIAPSGFMEHAVSENVYAGTAMQRRATFMYGDQIPKGPEHQIGTGLGMTCSTGSNMILKPTEIISENKELLVDGVRIIFQLTPGTEAPSEMNFFFPQVNALCMAENATHTMHNIQTLRGALVRDAHMWSKYMDESIQLFGDKVDVVFASHHWPTWGRDSIRKFMEGQRDMYAYMNDQTLRLINVGQTGLEIAEDFELPSTLSSQWCNQGYYGSISHNVKAIYHRYMGWFDGNPAHLWEHPPVKTGQLYIECFGGVGNLVQKAKEYQASGNLRFAATLLSHAVFGTSPPDHTAMNALADVLQLLGWGSSCGPWRNFYLVGAYELRHGIQAPKLGELTAASYLALELDELIDTMAIRLDGPRTPTDLAFTIQFNVTDIPAPANGNILLTLSNCALTNHPVTSNISNATLSCTLTHAELVTLVMGGKIDDVQNAVGDRRVWTKLQWYLTKPDPAFAIVTPEPIPEPVPTLEKGKL